MTRRVLPLCALLLVALLCAASLAGVAEARRGGGSTGFRNTYYPAGRHGTRRNYTRSANGAACSRGLSGGTWTACLGSSLLAAATVLL